MALRPVVGRDVPEPQPVMPERCTRLPLPDGTTMVSMGEVGADNNLVDHVQFSQVSVEPPSVLVPYGVPLDMDRDALVRSLLLGGTTTALRALSLHISAVIKEPLVVEPPARARLQAMLTLAINNFSHPHPFTIWLAPPTALLEVGGGINVHTAELPIAHLARFAATEPRQEEYKEPELDLFNVMTDTEP